MLLSGFALSPVAQAAEDTQPAGVALASAAANDEAALPKPVPAADATHWVLEGVVEYGYEDDRGRYVVDLLERDKAYLGVRITTPKGQPVVGAKPTITAEGSSKVLRSDAATGADGSLNFGVIGGKMGLDKVVVSLGFESVEFAINVVSLESLGFPTLQTVEGGIGWAELMQARLRYNDMGWVASFPESIASRAGKTVKLSGFMLPLDPESKQKHFLLTSNPPSCFFHVPGGPAGSVEILAPEGVEVTWDPVVLSGRFEPQETSELGVVYRLVNAKLVRP